MPPGLADGISLSVSRKNYHRAEVPFALRPLLYLERRLNLVCQSAQLHMLTKPRKIAHRPSPIARADEIDFFRSPLAFSRSTRAHQISECSQLLGGSRGVLSRQAR